jgi:hypothetical protein
LLIIDDAIYSGKSVCHVISALRDQFSHFTVITYASNKRAEKHICDEAGFNVEFLNRCLPQSIISFFVNVEQNKMSNVNLVEYEEDLVKKLGTVAYTSIIYFDHKIHDSLVTIYPKNIFDRDAYPERIPAIYIESIRRKITYPIGI